MSTEIAFLDVGLVLRLHRSQLEQFGGSDGLRDRGLLESAVSQAQSSFGGEYLHAGLFAMAAAYLFHLVKNHPFVDGNKRTGLLASLYFLDVNGVVLEQEAEELYELTMGVAEGRIEKNEVAVALERIVGGAGR